MSEEHGSGAPLLGILREALTGLRQSDAEAATLAALAGGVEPERVYEDGLTSAMEEVGRRWDAGRLFLPQVMVAARIFARCARIVDPRLQAARKGNRGPVVVLATVKGDVHDLGKAIVGSMLRAHGCQVHDLGKDVPTADIVAAVERERPAVLGLSAMLTSTMTKQQEVIQALEQAGLRSEVRVLVGGAPVSARWAESIGADGYGPSAAEAIRLVARS